MEPPQPVRLPPGFDVKTFCQNLKATKPPYECPLPSCGKVYKSYNGIHFHMYNFHNGQNESTPEKGSKEKKVGGTPGMAHHRSNPDTSSYLSSPRKLDQPLSYAESQRIVEIELDGKIQRINIYDTLEIIPQEEIDNCSNSEKEESRPDKSPQKLTKAKETPRSKNKNKKEPVVPQQPPPPPKLPEASFCVLDKYCKPPSAPARPKAYYRFIEKTTEELDDEIEYDMDEEDYAWLDLVNEQRKKENLSAVSQETFELLMDRFEKEAFFQSQTCGKDVGPPIDEDAVCSICMDGECQNSNVILFCDMCNLAVHQECYGVPYIPEGQWLCRRCLQSPSRAVECCLCPNKGGAFKQTDDGRWAHVVCALWVPEVGFANTVFLEPIDCLKNIPAARWKLSCYICKQRGTGACIQCHKTNCYTAFHVTCAQQAGLFMKIEPVKEMTVHGTIMSVRKTAFCDVHTPADMDNGPMIDNGVSSDDDSMLKSPITPAEAKAKSRVKMRRARKILAEKRNAIPVVSIPTIPPKKLSNIASKVSIGKKNHFMSRLQGYWTLKRQSRNGVPLLRRLQSSHMTRGREQGGNDKQSIALREQLKYWQRLRQDLEKARLLVELIRKREKLKMEHLRFHQMATEMQLTPFLMLLRNSLDQLLDKDPQGIFTEPVDRDEVPDYYLFIKQPMDFETMRNKVEGHKYTNMDQFETDFDLVVNNCMSYNAKDTSYYRAAVKLRDQGGAVIRATRRICDKVGYDPETGLHLDEPPKLSNEACMLDDDNILNPEARENMTLEEQLRILLDRLDLAQAKPHRKSRLAKQLKKEIIKVRRQLAIQKGQGDFFISETEDKDTADTASELDESNVENKSSRSQSPEKSKKDLSPQPIARSPVRRSISGRGRGGRRGRGGKRRHSVNVSKPAETAAPEPTPEPVAEPAEKEPADDAASTTSSKDRGSEVSAVSTPSGVNRRTAVLFGKKKGKKNGNPSNQNDSLDSSAGSNIIAKETVAVKENKAPGRKAGRPPRHRLPPECGPSDVEPEIRHKDKSPGSPHGRKRTASSGPSLALDMAEPSSKRSQSTSDASMLIKNPSSPFVPQNKDSFLQYRSGAAVPYESGVDTCSDTATSETSMSDTESSDGSNSDVEASEARYTKRNKNKDKSSTPRPPKPTRTRSQGKLTEQNSFDSITPIKKLPQKQSAEKQKQADFVAALTPSNRGKKRSTSGTTPNAKRQKSAKKRIDMSNQRSILDFVKKKPSSKKKLMVETDENETFELAAGPDLGPVSPSSSAQTTPNGTPSKINAAVIRQIDSMVGFLVRSLKERKPLESLQDATGDLPIGSPVAGLLQCVGSKPASPAAVLDAAAAVVQNSWNTVQHKEIRRSRRTRSGSWCSEDADELIPLEPLDLVWAKCRGYPWYPALIINPKMPKTGYFHNGVPIPVPPEDVLLLQVKYEDAVFLVLFFDTKRTWQWLPRNKLEPLGVDSGLDKAKLLENKKPNVRKAVKTAYEKAILHRCKVTGEPNPLTPDSDTEV